MVETAFLAVKLQMLYQLYGPLGNDSTINNKILWWRRWKNKWHNLENILNSALSTTSSTWIGEVLNTGRLVTSLRTSHKKFQLCCIVNSEMTLTLLAETDKEVFPT